MRRILHALWVFGIAMIPARAGPLPPSLIFPGSNAVNVGDSPPLRVRVSEPANGPLTVRYFGRLARSAGPDFTLVALPDSQYYTANRFGGVSAMFAAQADWIVTNRTAWNIAYVAHLGDIVDHGDTNGGPSNLTEWRNTTNALYRLENPLTTQLADGIPYGLAVGNHDQSPNGVTAGTTTYYNQFFGVSRFSGRGYYGGHYGTNNDNHFDLFSASGLDFIAIYLEYDTNATPAVLNWAGDLLRTYSNRQAVVVSHYLGRAATPSTFGAQGAAIYSALKPYTNLFLMLCGHVNGEGSRQDVFHGNTVTTLVADYQFRTNGGNGFLRLLQFSPSNNVIRVFTYSPWSDQYEADADSEFILPHRMPPAMPSPATNFAILHTATGVASGSIPPFGWSGLQPNSTYEWFVTITDTASNIVTGPVWRFTTAPSQGARHDVAAGLLRVLQIPGFGGTDENYNCDVTQTLSVNDFRAGTFNRADYSVQISPTAAQNARQGVLLSCVTENGRDNYGTNLFATSAIETNASGSYRIVTFSSPNSGAASGAGFGYEYNTGVAGAWFPYATWFGGFVRNSPGTNGGVWNLLTGSPGLALGTHVVGLGGGKGVVDLTSLGIDSRTDGVLLVNHARDEGNYALSQVNSNNGTWNVFVKDNSAATASDYEQDPFTFVFVPRANSAVISGRFLANGAVDMFSGSAPLFTVTPLGTGRWELKITGRTPAEGVLIFSAEGGSTYNLDNLVTCQVTTNGDGWEIQSRDTPKNGLQTPGSAEPVASFVYVPTLRPGLAVQPENLLVTEGSAAILSVMLDTPPTASVLVSLVSSDTNEVSLAPARLTFTTDNWHVPQVVAVRSADDLVPDGDSQYIVSFTMSSVDPRYAGLRPSPLPVTVLDNEAELTLPSGEVSYGIGMTGIALDGRATVVDPQTANYQGGSLIITLTTNGTATDRLEIRNVGTGAGQIGFANNNVTWGGGVIGSVAGGVGTAPLVIQLSSAATPEAVQALLRAVTFRNASLNPSLRPRTVAVTLVDVDGGASTASTRVRVGLVRISDFQEGMDRGYGIYHGAADAELYEPQPNTPFPTGHSIAGLWMDVRDDGATNAANVLLRFDNIIGDGPGQIPTHALIVNAELSLDIVDSGDGSPLYRMRVPWNAETATWNSLGGGLTPDGVRARSSYDSQLGVSDGTGSTGVGLVTLGVTPDVQAWANGETNHGWVMPVWSSTTTDGTAFSPCEAEFGEERPRLRVLWVPAGTAWASFAQGVNGYTGAQDTRIRETSPNTTFATVTTVYCDWAVSGTADNEQVLLRFDRIVGTGAGQIPPGARVDAAMLDLAGVISNAPGDGGQFYALLRPWQDSTTTWNSWGSGIQANGVKAAVTPSAIVGNASGEPNVPGAYLSFDMTADVQAWVSGNQTNYGWVMLPWPGGADGWGFSTSETTIQRDRPRLRVFYTALINTAVTLLPPVWKPTQVQIRFVGPAGSAGAVQRAAALDGSWTTLGSAVVGEDGIGTFLDTAPLTNTAFYRIQSP